MRDFNLVLLIEDDEIDTYLISNMLQRSQVAHKVIRCENGKQALDVVEQIYPDLILLDIAMPVMDGLEFLEAFRQQQHGGQVPVVLLTSSNNPHDIQRAAQYHATYYVVKPLTQEKLAKMIERI